MREDDFLRRYWQAPDPVFARQLQRRLTARPAVTIMPIFSPAKQMGRALNIIGMGLAAIVALSPDARSRLWRQI